MVIIMNSGPDAVSRRERLHFGFLAADVLRLLRADFASRASGMPLTPALHRLLIYVYRQPGCRQVELAEWLDITPVTVGRMIDRLERQRLVRRERFPDDRRASRVVVDEGAKALLMRLEAMAGQTRERAFNGLTESQRDEFLAVLTRIRDNLAMSPVDNTAPKRRSRVR
jgi:DNA-binding MarR family transcriptional regulator